MAGKPLVSARSPQLVRGASLLSGVPCPLQSCALLQGDPGQRCPVSVTPRESPWAAQEATLT